MHGDNSTRFRPWAPRLLPWLLAAGGVSAGVGLALPSQVLTAGGLALMALAGSGLALACRALESGAHTEAAARAALEDRRRALTADAPFAWFEAESAGGRIIAANTAFLELAGAAAVRNVVGRAFAGELFGEAADWDRLRNRMAAPGQLPAGEPVSLCGRQGSERQAILFLIPGGPGRMEGVLADVTAQSRSEASALAFARAAESARRETEERAGQLLEQSLELAAARDQAVRCSQLRSGYMGHLVSEVQGPLESITRMCGVLAAAGLPRQHRDLAKSIGESAGSLLDGMSGVLEYARLENGPARLTRESFSLRLAVEESVEQWAEQAEAHGLDITCLIRAGVPDSCVGDPLRVRQVISALVENAVRSTHAGEVSVVVSLAGREGGAAQVRFQVEDTGPGLEPEKAEQVFEPFANPLASGAGLGSAATLAVARRLVEAMGGQIGLDTEPGQGSLFWFLLPLESPEQGAADAGRLAGRRVLVVDDVPAVRGAVAEMLVAMGATAATAAGGAHALEMIQEATELGRPFDAAFVDYEMPDMGGLDLAEAVLDDPATAATAVFLLIPFSQRRWREEPVLEGLRSVLTKPVRATELEKCLRELDLEAPAISGGDEIPAAEPVPARADGAAATPGYAPVVLVAEDNFVNQKVAVRLVEKMGYRVEVAGNGREAVAALRDRHFDLVLMDCQMPEMDGFTATTAIRALGPDAAGVPIIAMTANAMRGDRERCLAAGMDDYISKPVAYEDLRRIVSKWLSKRPAGVSIPA